MADTRYVKMRAIAEKAFGRNKVAQFNRLFSSTESTTTSDLWDLYVVVGARVYSAAHPTGFAWRRRIKEVTTSVTHEITIDASFDSTFLPEHEGFSNIQARRGSAGDWRSVFKIPHLEAINRGLLNRTAIAAGQLPTDWSMFQDGSTLKLYLWPFSIEDADDVDLYLPYTPRIPSIDGASNPDESMMWDTADDMAISNFASMFAARQVRDWSQFEASKQLGFALAAERLAAMNINEIGLAMKRLERAIIQAEQS